MQAFSNDDIAIVLTATIVPNSTFVSHANPQERRAEYINAIHFYRQFAPVYFLENSAYPLSSDGDFQSINNAHIRKLPVSKDVNKGKGYQEFEMLDRWISGEKNPPRRWIKITGRYICVNFDQVFHQCVRYRKDLIIDHCRRLRLTHTDLFYVTTSYYRRHFLNIYKGCDDEVGEFIERVIYRKLSGLPDENRSIFRVEPRISTVSGSTNVQITPYSKKRYAKAFLRRFNWAIDKRTVWYTR